MITQQSLEALVGILACVGGIIFVAMWFLRPAPNSDAEEWEDDEGHP